ncbi:MAG TPA: hypothetical protein VNN09_00100 [Candidatus Competibacteraceae bacterium]|nr:hypothetical protein [Candidatus Competibacteraceae bacterium]
MMTSYLHDPWTIGIDQALEGAPLEANPYRTGSLEWTIWRAGWEWVRRHCELAPDERLPHMPLSARH